MHPVYIFYEFILEGRSAVIKGKLIEEERNYDYSIMEVVDSTNPI